ncbi:hypothetical protein QTJ16_002278 [Diplocarpon rosae]|uniref:UDENN FLCN/SMCR8-type domain-containing protein n=1 Tax=Diplocarpon rosae TaxID=946125 RepID=A0AAD9WF94_9HELO|nr:hypothetical protein QTJ16_002278 [Diplocarpon rosae]PBP15987.1 hypothetical protein BUE80_DR013128 [Diplocarpon rosae]
MASSLCLAHYCDTHGPTPLMVTEGLPVGCTSCVEDEGISTRRPSSSRSLDPADALPAIAPRATNNNSTSSEKEGGDDYTAVLSPTSSSAIETPLESPRIEALQSPGSNKRNSSFGKTYDENDKKRSAPCDNCKLTLPKPAKESPAVNRVDNNAPILRTRKPYERVRIPSPPSSNSSQSSDSDHAVLSIPVTRKARPRTLARAGTSCSDSSFSITPSHKHYLDYTSTHEPLAPTSFSKIRQSCLRTLSCETLPPSSTPIAPSPSSPLINSSLSSGPTSVTSTSGGPIFFGDPYAGYTTAYIFRIPDQNARGRRRVYALMSLSTHRERAAMQSFSFLSDAFRKIAAWIQGLAESELERAEAINSPRWSNVDSPTSHSTPTSSFLSSRNRGPDSKFAGISLRAKGLAELVGMPDFFLKLHTVFVKLLIELNVIFGL